MSKAVVKIGADTAEYERKLEMIKRKTGTLKDDLAKSLPVVGQINAKMIAVGAAVGLAAAQWAIFQRRMTDASKQVDVTVDRLGRATVGFGLARQLPQVRQAVVGAAGAFDDGTTGATAAFEAFTATRSSGAGIDEVREFMDIVAQASMARLDPEAFARVVGLLREMGVEMQAAGDIAAVAIQQGAKGVETMTRIVNSSIARGLRGEQGLRQAFAGRVGFTAETAATYSSLQQANLTGQTGALIALRDQVVMSDPIEEIRRRTRNLRGRREQAAADRLVQSAARELKFESDLGDDPGLFANFKAYGNRAIVDAAQLINPFARQPTVRGVLSDPLIRQPRPATPPRLQREPVRPDDMAEGSR